MAKMKMALGIEGVYLGKLKMPQVPILTHYLSLSLSSFFVFMFLLFVFAMVALSSTSMFMLVPCATLRDISVSIVHGLLEQGQLGKFVDLPWIGPFDTDLIRSIIIDY